MIESSELFRDEDFSLLAWKLPLFNPPILLWVHECSIMSDSWDTMHCSPPGSSVHGIFQECILEQVAISFSRGSFWSRDWTYHILCLRYWQADSLPLVPPENLVYYFTNALFTLFLLFSCCYCVCVSMKSDMNTQAMTQIHWYWRLVNTIFRVYIPYLSIKMMDWSFQWS